MNDLKTLFVEIRYSCSNVEIIGINTGINCTYGNLGLLFCWFFCVTWAQFMATLYCFAARCLFGVVFLDKAKQGRWLFAVSAYKSLPHQRTAHRFTRHESAKSLRPGQSLIFSPRQGHCVVFCGKFFWKCLVLGNLTCAQEPRCLRVAWWTRSFYIRSSIG